MCGIVGYSGSGDAVTPVIEGLSRLEYRGYDSAGISIQDSGSLKIYKKEGKLQNLKNVLDKEKPVSHIAIGHTRWATHGKVNDINAHPHSNDMFSIVHNGIIENAEELKEQLNKEGYHFKSETDTEIFLNQLTFEFEKCADVSEAIRSTFTKVRGNSAFVVMKRDSHMLYAIKRSAPLVCGVSTKTEDVYFSSDPYALVGFANKIFFPGDEVLCIGDCRKPDSLFTFVDIEGNPSKDYKSKEQDSGIEVISKGDFEHFMLKEIFEQPELVKKMHTIYKNEGSRAHLISIAAQKPNFVHIAACGTAYHAGLLVKNYIETMGKVRVQAELASEFRYKKPILNKSELGLFISQSGETADTLATQEMCKKNGLSTCSIVNVEGSTLFRECENNLLIHAGVEIGVASTKAFTQQVLVGYLLGSAFSGEYDQLKIDKEIESLARGIESVLARASEIEEIAKNIYQYKGFIFTGRGEQFPIALEGALKLKEIAYVHAEGYAAGELKHGPISLIDENMVNIAIITPELYDKTLSNAEEVRARRGVMLVVGAEKDKNLERISDYYFGINFDGVNETKPILTNIVLQLLSYYIAKLKGTDIDKPRNLAKSVTVE